MVDARNAITRDTDPADNASTSWFEQQFASERPLASIYHGWSDDNPLNEGYFLCVRGIQRR